VKTQTEVHINILKTQLKEWTDTANKLINSKADFDEWR
jgi:hypothetical protein